MSTDPVLKYSDRVGLDLVCNYCGWKVKGGGVTRMKYHLSGKDPQKNARKCLKCPPEVVNEMLTVVAEMQTRKKGKTTVDELLQKTARGSDDDADSDSDDQETRDMRRAMKLSRAETYTLSGHGGSSQRSQPSPAPSLYRTELSKQKRLPEMINPKLKKKFGRLVSKFFIHEHVPANKADSHHFKNMMAGAQDLGNYYLALNSLLDNRNALRAVFGSDWWEEQKLSSTPKGVLINERICTTSFWERVKSVTDVFEPIYKSLRWVDTEVFPTMGVIYQLIQTMKKQIHDRRYSDWVIQIMNKRWEKNLCHPLHEAAFYLNPSIQYDPQIQKPDSCMQAVLKVFEKLYKNDPNIRSLANELLAFRDARGTCRMSSAIGSRGKMPPAEWWVMFGADTLTLTKLAVRILAQTVSSSACERNWSTFALVHTKQRNRLAYKTLEKLVYCSYNMKLMLRDTKAAAENVLAVDPLDMIERSMERMGPMDEDELVNWIRPAHLDDEQGRPDPVIREQAQNLGVDVDQAAVEAGIDDDTVNTLGSSDDGDGGDDCGDGDDGGAGDGGDDGGGGGEFDDGRYDSDRGPGRYDAYQPAPSQQSGWRPWTEESGYFATQDSDHGSRRGGHGATNRDFQPRRRSMHMGSSMSYSVDDMVEQMSGSFGNMSMTGESSVGSYPYGYYEQVPPPPEPSYESYGVHQPYVAHVPTLQQVHDESSTFDFQHGVLTLVKYPILSQYVRCYQSNYDLHVKNYEQHCKQRQSWEQYCADVDQQHYMFPNWNNRQIHYI